MTESNSAALETADRDRSDGRGSDPIGAILGSPMLWGTAVTFAFYAALPHLPVHRDLFIRYFCSHPLEYATTGLFFIGLALLASKALRSVVESAGFRNPAKAVRTAERANDPVTTAGNIENSLGAFPEEARRSTIATRIGEVCSYVRGRRTTAGLEEHLKYLAELAADRLHGSYALIRTITWAVPILGFLGTVIGITIAIANVTPEQLDTSLGDVTGGLAVAFDTTALALALSLVLVFASFVVERREQSVLDRVEDFGVRELMPLFPEDATSSSPLADAERQAAETLLAQTESMVNDQVRVWNESLETMRSRWQETLTAQQSQLDDALSTSIGRTLEEHERRLADTRAEFLNAFESISTTLRDGIATSQTGQRLMQEQFASDLDQTWSQLRAGLGEMHEQNAARVDTLAEALAERLGGWLTRLEETNESAAEQQVELRRQGEVLLRVVEQEENLARLQQRLDENLDAVRSAETFEEALHELTAAVHLLTARAKKAA